MASKPQPRDVIVHKRNAEQQKPSTIFSVSVVGGQEQVFELTYERALNQADSFARHDHVDVWYTEDGSTFRSITRRRPT